MAERLTQRRRVKDEGPMGRKLLLEEKNVLLQAALTVSFE